MGVCVVHRWMALVILLLGFSRWSGASSPWLPFGPDGGFARRLAADPHDATHLYLGAANGWMYESHNGGGAWRRLARVGRRDDLVIDSIVIDPANPKHLLVGAWVIDKPDGGIYTSDDGGANWTAQAEMRGQSVRSVAMSLSAPQTLVAGTLRGVFRTTDGGRHWVLISPEESLEIHNVESVAIDPADPNTIYAGTWHLPWKTTDGGAHWANIKDGIIDDSDVFSIIVDPKTPQTVFASACSGIYKSENGGTLFHKVQGIPSTARRTRVLLQDPNHLETVFAGTTEGLFRSDDAGKTWTRTTGPEIVVNDVLVDASDSRHVVLATDRSGVLSSDDGGDTFHSSNAGFSSRQVTAMLVDAQQPSRLYVGVVNDKEWGGVFVSENGGPSWMQQSDGLAGSDVFSLGQAPDGSVFAGTPHGLYRREAETGHWARVTTLPSSAVRVPAVVEPSRVRPPVPIERNRFTARTGRPTRAALSVRGRKAVSQKAHGAARAPARTGKAKVAAGKMSGTTRARTSTKSAARKTAAVLHPPVLAAKTVPLRTIATPSAPAASTGFDGAVFAMASSGSTLLAATSEGLERSDDNGAMWSSAHVAHSEAWRFLGAAGQNLIAASMTELRFSTDAGLTWVSIPLPEKLTRIAAAAVEPSGTLWVGGREGVYLSSDAGTTWVVLKNLYVTDVDDLFYDTHGARMLVTAGDMNSIVFSVQLPQHQVTYAASGWALRFARPVGDHLVGATFYDGIVIQPKMMPSPVKQ